MFGFSWTITAVLFVFVSWAATSAAQAAPPNSVLDRTTEYVRTFVRGFANVVAEERYVQTANPNNPGPGPQRRVLLSDFLLVKGQNANDWYQFRDVREVDGRPVSDRDRRLTELFLQPWDTAIRQAARIGRDVADTISSTSARLISRCLPSHCFSRTTAIGSSSPVGRLERDGGRELRVISFREPEVTSTVIGGRRSFGRAWVDEATGRVMRTELQLRDSAQKFVYTITTSFVIDERLQLAVPAEMRDSYPGFLDVTGVATYGNFRSFQVQTAEEVR